MIEIKFLYNFIIALDLPMIAYIAHLWRLNTHRATNVGIFFGCIFCSVALLLVSIETFLADFVLQL